MYTSQRSFSISFYKCDRSLSMNTDYHTMQVMGNCINFIYYRVFARDYAESISSSFKFT